MLEQIGSTDRIDGFLVRVKHKTGNVRLMGFGHRVYKNFDPRSMFTVMFAIARTAGWVAHWREMVPRSRIIGRWRRASPPSHQPTLNAASLLWVLVNWKSSGCSADSMLDRTGPSISAAGTAALL